MNLERQATGHSVALRLDPAGTILDVLADGSGRLPRTVLALRFDEIIHASGSDKARAFVARVLADGTGYGWELPIARDRERIEVFAFAGARQDDGSLVVVGAGSTSDLEQMYDDFLRLNNEQTNVLRSTVKELSRAQRESAREARKTYEEMTALNNELAGMQRELARTNAQLARLNTDKNQLLGMVAHDLRNPLNVVAGYASMMLGGLTGELAPAQREFVTSIHRASQHMLSMVEDLLDLSAVESGCIRLDRSQIDLRALLADAVKLNQLLADQKQIKIELFASDVLQIDADQGKLSQVINNLLSNAVKYSHPSTTVRVEVERASEQIVLRVRDEGQGIPPAELASMFQPFSRTSVKSTAGEKSTGLGLAIVRKIVEAHGGKISVESEVGRGSTFTVVLPATERESPHK